MSRIGRRIGTVMSRKTRHGAGTVASAASTRACGSPTSRARRSRRWPGRTSHDRTVVQADAARDVIAFQSSQKKSPATRGHDHTMARRHVEIGRTRRARTDTPAPSSLSRRLQHRRLLPARLVRHDVLQLGLVTLLIVWGRCLRRDHALRRARQVPARPRRGGRDRRRPWLARLPRRHACRSCMPILLILTSLSIIWDFGVFTQPYLLIGQSQITPGNYLMGDLSLRGGLPQGRLRPRRRDLDPDAR